MEAVEEEASVEEEGEGVVDTGVEAEVALVEEVDQEAAA